jgi:hypothetical protein
MRAAFALLLLSATAVLAQDNPIAGVYGNEGGCRRVAGQPEGTDLVFILAPDRIERYESTCPITRLVLDGEGAPAQADVTCSGEGETWTDSYLLSPLPGEDGYIIGPAEYPDIRFEVRPCG